MNIHPLFVHFPIALLSLYAIFEIIRFKKILRLSFWFYTKAIIVIAGALSAIPTLLTGEPAEHLYNGPAPRSIIELHSTFAGASVTVFGIIALLYLLKWFSNESLFTGNVLVRNVYAIVNYIFRPWVLVTLALVGFTLLSITGTLGGSLVYGQHSDVFIEAVYRLLNISY